MKHVTPTAASRTIRMPPRRKVVKLVLALVGVLVLAWLVAWRFPQQWLTVDSGPVSADVLVVLGGGSGDRPRCAAELFQAGEAPRILCSGLGDCESNQRLIVREGVPPAVIQLECESRNTSENARLTIALLRKQGVKRVIIVTAWFHSRRALNCFEHYAPEIQFYSRPSHYASARADWKTKKIAGEYAKNLGYLFRYGVSPL